MGRGHSVNAACESEYGITGLPHLRVTDTHDVEIGTAAQ
jgi:hypothetical protein